ncbi:MAG: type II secretion system protein [Rickettsiales bacterium]
MNRMQHRGFSLLELSVVLIIVSLVAAMGIGLGGNALKGADRLATQEKLAALKKALNQFARQNGYLPCPADRTLTPSSANYGVEGRQYSGTGYTGPFTATFSGGGGTGAAATLGASVTAGAVTGVALTAAGSGYTSAPTVSLTGGGGSGGSATATIFNGAVAYVTVPSCSTASGVVLSGETYIGMIPVRTLGLPDSFAADSWGDKITYAANANLTEGPDSYLKPVIGGPLVYYGTLSSAQIATRLPVADNSAAANGVAAFVALSHGPDGRGAYPVDSTSVIGSCGSTSPDAENCDEDNSFIDGRYFDGTQASTFYDDYMVWDTNLAGQAPLSNVASVTPTTLTCSTSPAVCEQWCAPCTTNVPAAPANMSSPRLCSRVVITTSPCAATCLWGGTVNATGKTTLCP